MKRPPASSWPPSPSPKAGSSSLHFAVLLFEQPEIRQPGSGLLVPSYRTLAFIERFVPWQRTRAFHRSSTNLRNSFLKQSGKDKANTLKGGAVSRGKSGARRQLSAPTCASLREPAGGLPARALRCISPSVGASASCPSSCRKIRASPRERVGDGEPGAPGG